MNNDFIDLIDKHISDQYALIEALDKKEENKIKDIWKNIDKLLDKRLELMKAWDSLPANDSPAFKAATPAI